MDLQDILRRVDHTLLSPTATYPQVQTLCEEAIAYQTASVCIPPIMWFDSRWEIR